MTSINKIILVFGIVITNSFLFAQNLGINNTGALPNNSAGLDIDFSDKGLLIPRVSLTSTTDINTIPNPDVSLLVYNTNPAMQNGGEGFYYFDGTKWTQKFSSGSTGQSANTVYSNNQLQLSSNVLAYTLIPGLTQTITVPDNAKVFISTDGGFQNAGIGDTYSLIDFAVFIDGNATSLQRRVLASNTPGAANVFGNWNLSSVFTLSPGSHVIQVRVKDSGQSTAGTNVAGTNDLIKGNLTVLVITE